MARPALVFSSAAIRTALVAESHGYGLVRAIRKRKERIPIIEVLRDEDRQLIQMGPFLAVLFLLKKQLYKLLMLIAQTFSALRFIKRRRTVFEVWPLAQYFLSLSVLRI